MIAAVPERIRPHCTWPAAVLAAAVLVAPVLVGCAVAPEAPLTVDDVVAERTAAVEAVERAQFDQFLGQSSRRFEELGLPLPVFRGLVPLDEWDAVVTACIERLDPQLDVSRLEGGFTVNYFGVVGESYERIRWTIEGCNAQFGIDDPSSVPVAGVVEAAWRYQDATQRVLPCLRHIGAPVPSPPAEITYVEHLGTGREWSPYALASTDPAMLVRAVALCPPSVTVLEARLAEPPAQTSRGAP